MGVEVSATEAAQLAGVSERTVRTWIQNGKLKAHKPQHDLGKPATWRIDIDDLAKVPGVTIDTARGASVSLQADSEVLRRLTAIEQTLAELRERSPWLFGVSRLEAIPTVEVPPIRLPVQRPAARLSARPRGTLPASRTGLPSSARAWAEWIATHGGPQWSGVRSWAELQGDRTRGVWATWSTFEDAAAVMRAHGYTPRDLPSSFSAIGPDEEAEAEE